MNQQVINYITDFILAGSALLALLIIIPAASASAQQLKPGWRAWVWPLAFLAFALGSLSAGLSLVLNAGDSDTITRWQLAHDLLLGLALTLLVLNSVYRVLYRRTAWYFAPFIWFGYICFDVATFTLTADRTVTLLIYSSSCALVLVGIYGTIYVLERERASDAVPALVAATLTTIANVVGDLNFKADWGWLGFNQELPAHLLQIPALFFFLAAASNGYVVKYALHRRQQREHLLVEVES